MKKALIAALALAAFVSPAFFPEAYARARDKMTLSEDLWGKKFDTFVAEPTDISGKASGILDPLRKEIEDALAVRVNISFNIVDNRDRADLVIECEVREYVLPGGPGGEEQGGAPLIGKILSQAGQGRVQAFFKVTDTKKGKVLWQREVRATVGASGDNAAEALNERLTTIFVRECFGKKKLRAAFPVRKEDPRGSY